MHLREVVLGTCAVSLAGIIASCVGDEPASESSATDAGSDVTLGSEASSPPDGDNDAGRTEAGACDPNAPFGKLEPIEGDVNTAANEYPGRLSRDGSQLLFVRSTIDSSLEIYLATRAGADGPFTSAAPVAALSSSSVEVEPSFGDDGKLVVFATRRPDGGPATLDLYASKRSGTDFEVPAPIPLLSTGSEEREPYLVDNGKALYFARDDDLYVSRRNSDGSFGNPSVVPGPHNTGDVEGSPVVTDDERTMYFKRAPAANAETADIFRATRPSATDPFGSAVAVPELSSAGLDLPAWISPDDCMILVSTNRDGHHDLYVARRPK